MKHIKRHVITALWALLPLGFLGVMVFAPLGALALYDEAAPLWAQMFFDNYYVGRLVWTVSQALCTVVITALLAVPLAWALVHWDFWGRTVVLRLLMLPFVMPALVVGMGVLLLFGETGMIWRVGLDTPYLLLYANVFFNMPIMIRAAHQGLLSVPFRRVDAARVLGANVWQRFWHVQWPLLKRWLAGGACLVGAYSFSSFGLALLLGGQRYATIEVEIYRLIAQELDMAQATVLVGWTLVVMCSVALWYVGIQRAIEGTTCCVYPRQKPHGLWPKTYLSVVLTVWGLVCVLPLLAVLVQAVWVGEEAWRVLWETQTWQAVGNTLCFSALATALAAVVGWAQAVWSRRMRWARGMVFVPLMVSPVCLAFGVLLLYAPWGGSLWLLIAVYALMAYPLVAKDVLAAWDNLSERHAVMARVCGANGVRVATSVWLPALWPALRRGLTLAAATGLGEFAATLFLSRPEWTTLSTLIYQYWGRIGAENHDRAVVLSLVLLVFSVLVFGLLDVPESRQRDF